jgi:hypothetical protein
MKLQEVTASLLSHSPVDAGCCLKHASRLCLQIRAFCLGTFAPVSACEHDLPLHHGSQSLQHAKAIAFLDLPNNIPSLR